MRQTIVCYIYIKDQNETTTKKNQSGPSSCFKISTSGPAHHQANLTPAEFSPLYFFPLTLWLLILLSYCKINYKPELHLTGKSGSEIDLAVKRS